MLRRHLLVSTWHMRVQGSSIVMLLTGRAQIVLHTEQAACYTEPAVVQCLLQLPCHDIICLYAARLVLPLVCGRYYSGVI